MSVCSYGPRCIKFAFERKSEKSNARMRDSDWVKINLRLIFLICVQTQILCNGQCLCNMLHFVSYTAGNLCKFHAGFYFLRSCVNELYDCAKCGALLCNVSCYNRYIYFSVKKDKYRFKSTQNQTEQKFDLLCEIE